MNIDFGDWYRIANLNADHDTLQKRWKGVQALVADNTCSSVYDLARFFHGLPATASSRDSAIAEAAFNADSAFNRQNCDAEVAVLAGAAISEIILHGSDSLRDTAALAVVVPSIQGTRRSAIIPRIIEGAEQHLASRSSELREDDGANFEIPDIDEDSVETIMNALAQSAPPTAAEPFAALANSLIDALTAHSSQITALRKSYSLLREESDMLWWMTSSHSRTVDKAFSEIDIAPACLYMARELAHLTRVIPGPLGVKAFSQRVFDTCYPKTAVKKAVGISMAVNGVTSAAKGKWVEQMKGRTALDLCAISTGIVQSDSVEGPEEWQPLFKKSQRIDATSKLTPSLLARQFYLESLLLRIED